MSDTIELTPEQEALLPAWRQEWLDIGIQAGPCNRALVEPAVDLAYELLGYQHQTVEFVPSPFAAQREIGKRQGNLTKETSPWFWGQHEAYWVSYYLFMQEIVGKPQLDPVKLALMADLCRGGGWVYLFERGAFVCDRPRVSFQQSPNGIQLHNEHGPAIEYEDDLKIYALNGIVVPSWLVLKRAADLDPATLTALMNVEVRREFVRKVGIERIVQTLAPTGPIDTATFHTEDGRPHFYELYRFRVHEDFWTYLKMRNPSVDLFHVEGVPNNCQTVREALEFRWNLDRDLLSEDGARWHVQGDVILKPKRSSLLKPFPSVLTVALLGAGLALGPDIEAQSRSVIHNHLEGIIQGK